ncbi:MAG: VTT domain-containing protein [Dehalococcoidales bacterium]|nr:VTT domain-containing protein [Dehalococcoidales bacterium]MDZ4230790.1 VTT domain-containing protein [Dehalococcoidales bacterium]
MEVAQIERRKSQSSWCSYLLIIGVVILFIVLPMAMLVYFREAIQKAQSYGYLGVFIAGVLAGITVIPFPTFWLVFTLGHVLNPPIVGLIAGLGGALGGITVYLVGSGVGTILSRLQAKEEALQRRLGLSEDVKLPRLRSWWESKAIYNRLTSWVRGKGGAWVVFFASASPINPFFYPAGLAAGSLGMGLARFFFISWAGKTVKFSIIAFVGKLGLGFILRAFGL